MSQSLDLFPLAKWATRPDAEHKEAMEQFKAAVMASRSGNDDSIKQVVLTSYRFEFYLGFFANYKLPMCVGCLFLKIFTDLRLASRPEMPRFFNFCCRSNFHLCTMLVRLINARFEHVKATSVLVSRL